MRLSTAVVLALSADFSVRAAQYSLVISEDSPYSFSIIDEDGSTIVSNSAILAGSDSYENVLDVDVDSEETLVDVEFITKSIARVQINNTQTLIGARFHTHEGALHYGVWAYPFDGSTINTDLTYELKGLQIETDINYSSVRAPFWISSTGYAVYTDTMKIGQYSFSDTEQEVSFVFNSTQLTYYVILPDEESNIKSLLTQYATLTDTTAFWSPKGYGPMFWHDDWTREDGFPDGVTNAQEFIKDTLDVLQSHKIHTTSIMADRPFGTGTEGWGNFDFDEDQFPDIGGLIGQLSDHDIDFQIWAANRAVEDSELYSKADDNGWLFDEMATDDETAVALNLSIPGAYEYFKTRMDEFYDLGVKGFKIDRGDEKEIPAYEENVQTYLYHKLLYEGQASRFGGSSGSQTAGFYQFARSANDRSRKYTGAWNGDPASSVAGLTASIKSGIRSGLLGFPMWGCDTGGYNRKAGFPVPDATLWARWMWFSAFSPVYELMIHVGSVPWYDYDESWLMDVLKASTDLHHDLIPFIQSYIFKSTYDGLPLIRALFLQYPKDDSLWAADESYFFGNEFLIAPVTDESGTKAVYFPKGTRYLEYFNKTDIYKGGEEVSLEYDVHSIPAFVCEGSIVPRGDIFRFNNDWVEDWIAKLIIEIYPGYDVEKSSFEYFNGESGKLQVIQVTTDSGSRTVCVSYEPLGTDGELTIYLKDGPVIFGLDSTGGMECVEGAETLFD